MTFKRLDYWQGYTIIVLYPSIITGQVSCCSSVAADGRFWFGIGSVDDITRYVGCTADDVIWHARQTASGHESARAAQSAPEAAHSLHAGAGVRTGASLQAAALPDGAGARTSRPHDRANADPDQDLVPKPPLQNEEVPRGDTWRRKTRFA